MMKVWREQRLCVQYDLCCKNPVVRRGQKRCYGKHLRITIDTVRSEMALKSS